MVYLGGRLPPSLFHAGLAPWMQGKELFAFSLPSAPVSPARSRQPAVLLPAASLVCSCMLITVSISGQRVAAWVTAWPHWFIHNVPPCFLGRRKAPTVRCLFYLVISLNSFSNAESFLSISTIFKSSISCSSISIFNSITSLLGTVAGISAICSSNTSMRYS